MNSLLSYLLTCLINKLRRLKLYVLKGEKSLLAEMVIVFTQLLVFEEMKQAMRNTRKSVGGVPVQIKLFPNFFYSVHNTLAYATVRAREIFPHKCKSEGHNGVNR